MMENNLQSMEVKQSAADDFLKKLDRKMKRLLFTTSATPIYTNSKGQCRIFWYGTVTEFWWKLRNIHPELYNVAKRSSSSSSDKKIEETSGENDKEMAPLRAKPYKRHADSTSEDHLIEE